MMWLPCRFRPLPHWPRAETSPRTSSARFRAGFDATLHELAWEADQLDAPEIVVQAGFTEADIRVDGMPRATAKRPSHPGVIVAFESMHGPLQYGTDVYDTWRANLRAIVLGLAALRAVDRHGITRTGEQYRGFRALGAGDPTPLGAGPGMTVDQAAQRLADAYPNEMGADPIAWQVHGSQSWPKAWRVIARTHHPDHGGDPDTFTELLAAKAVLEEHHR